MEEEYDDEGFGAEEDVEEEEGPSVSRPTDIILEEANILGFSAPFIVWGVFFGSLTWIMLFGRK